MNRRLLLGAMAALCGMAWAAEDFPKPYSPPCTERENVFEFTEKPQCRFVGDDKYEITFAVKSACDVTVGLIDEKGVVVRHVASGVLGANAPMPFQKNSLKQTLYWDGKDDLDNYVREPGKLRVRVMLGLKPEFDKRLGGASPYNIPGRVKGIAASPHGVFVFSLGGRSKFFIRKFDLAGNYVQSLIPSPANLPESKLRGMGFVEYESGKRTIHGADVYQSVADHLRSPMSNVGKLNEMQPVVVGERLYFGSTGFRTESAIYHMYVDGATDLEGISGRPLFTLIGDGRTGKVSEYTHSSPRLCASPDGKWLYMTGVHSGRSMAMCVYRLASEGPAAPLPWVGNPAQPGSDAKTLNGPHGIACDAQGRVYVADLLNNRLQVFSPEAVLLKSISISKPIYVCVHPKTGAIYVQQDTRVEGKTVRRTTKLRSLENPEEVGRLDGPYGIMALDAWSSKPRLWYSNTTPHDMGLFGDEVEIGNNVTVWEDEGASFRKIVDFDERTKKEDGALFSERWSGHALGHKVAADPTRETVLVGCSQLYDLNTGAYTGRVKIPAFKYNDMAYDKRGLLHVHLIPGFDLPGVIRVDPEQSRTGNERNVGPFTYYPEMPYDYGVEIPGKYSEPRIGALPVKDQPGAKFFQDGLGVNMKGDIAEQCNIYYVPKRDDIARNFIEEMRGDLGPGAGGKLGSYEKYFRNIQESEKRGEQFYSIRPQPGIASAGATVWTFHWTGELMTESAVVAGGLINGVQMDEAGKLRFVVGRFGRTRLINDKPFLVGRGGRFGANETSTPFTGTLICSTPEQNVKILWSNAEIPIEAQPRKPDLGDVHFEIGQRKTSGWVEGAEWLYAGASPIVASSCSCPTQRIHLDWYKRVYVPEQYRHSIGVLDDAGNLILHLGRYGNFDSGLGAKSKIPVGGDDIALSAVRFISGTDNYLVFDDGGERITVLKLNYHAEEAVPIRLR